MRCSELALALNEPLVATAPHAPVWKLVPHPGPWGRKAVEEAGVVGNGAKPLLVRSAPASEGRVFLVCTNGARDPCCALMGAAVVRALGDRARECTHLGGHRFAANVLVLPDNLLFGRLDAESAASLAASLDAGLLPLEHLRGRCALPPMQQAAEILLRRELGIETLDGLRHLEGLTFARANGDVVAAEVRGETLPPRRVSCRDDKEESPTAWELTSFASSGRDMTGV